VGIYLLYFFGNQAKLRNLIRIEFFLVAKGNWFERQDSFAGSIHRLDVILVACRRLNGAKLTTRVNDYTYTAGNSLIVDAANEGLLLSCIADTGDAGIGGSAENAGTDNDVVAAGGEI